MNVYVFLLKSLLKANQLHSIWLSWSSCLVNQEIYAMPSIFLSQLSPVISIFSNYHLSSWVQFLSGTQIFFLSCAWVNQSPFISIIYLSCLPLLTSKIALLLLDCLSVMYKACQEKDGWKMWPTCMHIMFTESWCNYDFPKNIFLTQWKLRVGV